MKLISRKKHYPEHAKDKDSKQIVRFVASAILILIILALLTAAVYSIFSEDASALEEQEIIEVEKVIEETEQPIAAEAPKVSPKIMAPVPSIVPIATIEEIIEDVKEEEEPVATESPVVKMEEKSVSHSKYQVEQTEAVEEPQPPQDIIDALDPNFNETPEVEVQDPTLYNYAESPIKIFEADDYTYEEYKLLSLEEKYELLVLNNYYGFTEEDYEYLVMTIVGEAQNCDYHHQMGVASVVLNRYYCDYYFAYGDTIKHVVTAPMQYTCFQYGGAYLTPTDTNKEVAMEVLRYGSIFPANVIFQAEFKQGQGVYEHYGNTYFCWKNIPE